MSITGAVGRRRVLDAMRPATPRQQDIEAYLLRAVTKRVGWRELKWGAEYGATELRIVARRLAAAGKLRIVTNAVEPAGEVVTLALKEGRAHGRSDEKRSGPDCGGRGEVALPGGAAQVAREAAGRPAKGGGAAAPGGSPLGSQVAGGEKGPGDEAGGAAEGGPVGDEGIRTTCIEPGCLRATHDGRNRCAKHSCALFPVERWVERFAQRAPPVEMSPFSRALMEGLEERLAFNLREPDES